MVKCRQEKLRWALKQKDKKNKDVAFLLGVKTRRFQQLKAQYRSTGHIPWLNPLRRPKMPLTREQAMIIDHAKAESKLNNAVALRLYIIKYYKSTISHNKIHRYLLDKGLATPDPKKKKQRKYCRYERTHSGSLGHQDFHDSKFCPGKKVIVWQDDASRRILSGGEYDEATTEVAKQVVLEAKAHAWNYRLFLRELNTDQGSQFYTTKKKGQNEKTHGEFETFLQEEGIKHIPSRRNHPQTNGKEERWFRTYEENRKKFATMDDFIKWYNNRIHLGLSRSQGITPNEAFINKLPPQCLLGLLFTKEHPK